MIGRQRRPILRGLKINTRFQNFTHRTNTTQIQKRGPVPKLMGREPMSQRYISIFSQKNFSQKILTLDKTGLILI